MKQLCLGLCLHLYWYLWVNLWETSLPSACLFIWRTETSVSPVLHIRDSHTPEHVWVHMGGEGARRRTENENVSFFFCLVIKCNLLWLFIFLEFLMCIFFFSLCPSFASKYSSNQKVFYFLTYSKGITGTLLNAATWISSNSLQPLGKSDLTVDFSVGFYVDSSTDLWRTE